MARRPSIAGLRGVTLVELLVGIGVIAVLAVLIVSASKGARERSDATRCLAHLRQWPALLAAYAAEHDGETPRRGQGVRPLTTIDREEDWFNALPPYAGMPPYVELARRGTRIQPTAENLFACPSAKDPHALNFLPFAMNMNISPTDRPHPHRLAEIENPSQLVFLADAPGAYSSTLPAPAPYSMEPRHAGRVNVVFVDGHAASFDAGYIGAGTGDPKRPDVQWEVSQQWTD